MIPRHGAEIIAIDQIVALDPSVSSAGASYWVRGTLRSAGNVKRRSSGATCYGEKCALMALDLMGWLRDLGAQPSALVFEWPQVYHAGKSEVPPKDLIPLAGVGMALAGMLWPGCAARNQALEIATPTPAEWVDNLPKTRTGDPWRSPRGARVTACLRPEERQVVPAQHDAIDAVGLGLWWLGRFDRPRVFPGAK